MKFKLPAFLETWIVKFALSKTGPYVQKAITLFAAYLVSFLADKIPGIEMYLNEAAITGILWVVIDSLYGMLPADIIKKYGRNIQEVLVESGKPVKVDGLALSKTTEAISEAFFPATKVEVRKAIPVKKSPVKAASKKITSKNPKIRK
jgi:hypothetical protein